MYKSQKENPAAQSAQKKYDVPIVTGEEQPYEVMDYFWSVNEARSAKPIWT